MAPHGEPTPDLRTERPRFRDSPVETFPNPDVNPYLAEHFAFGPPLLAARDAWRHRGGWAELFGREAPLHVEIGSGNGFFLSGLAAQRPDWNLLGIEIRYKRVVQTARKLRNTGAPHAWIARYDAWFLDDLFEDGALSGLYVNHPDPWPKTRHVKNRLVSRWFLEEACRLLRPGGWLRVKSDFRPNIDRVEHCLTHGERKDPAPRLPLEVTGRAHDVTAEPAPWSDDIETNYQSKFRRLGLPVYGIEVTRLADGAGA